MVVEVLYSYVNAYLNNHLKYQSFILEFIFLLEVFKDVLMSLNFNNHLNHNLLNS